jgi:hypothetical protein
MGNSLIASGNNDLDSPNFERFNLTFFQRSILCSRQEMEQSHYDSKGLIVSWRPKYLFRIETFREGNKSIQYTDEFRVNAGPIVQKVWRDKTDETLKASFCGGSTQGDASLGSHWCMPGMNSDLCRMRNSRACAKRTSLTLMMAMVTKCTFMSIISITSHLNR